MEEIFCLKNWSFTKHANLEQTLALRIRKQGSGPSKRDNFCAKICSFTDMVPGPVPGRVFIDFGTNFGRLFGTKMV